MNEKLLKIFGFVILFVVGSAGVLFVLPSAWIRVLFLLLMLAVLIWTARSGTKTDINTLALVTAYVLSVAQFAHRFYFGTPEWLIMLVVFVWVGLLFWLNFRLRLGSATASAKIISLVAGLAGAEVALALMFWPTHFLVNSTVFFLLFYLAWMTINFYMSGLLSRHRAVIHVVFTSVVLAAVLLTAQWRI